MLCADDAHPFKTALPATAIDALRMKVRRDIFRFVMFAVSTNKCHYVLLSHMRQFRNNFWTFAASKKLNWSVLKTAIISLFACLRLMIFRGKVSICMAAHFICVFFNIFPLTFVFNLIIKILLYRYLGNAKRK